MRWVGGHDDTVPLDSVGDVVGYNENGRVRCVCNVCCCDLKPLTLFLFSEFPSQKVHGILFQGSSKRLEIHMFFFYVFCFH